MARMGFPPFFQSCFTTLPWILSGSIRLMSHDPIDFARQLIKGRIAEVIFERMIRDEGRYTVIPFGYEQTVPTLAQYQHLVQIRQVMHNISDAPDFVLVSDDKTKVYLVEVKYRSSLHPDNIQEIAAALLKPWDPSWLFVATPEGFYCAPSSAAARKEKISRLSESWVTTDRQAQYLALLNEFEKK
jgi:hypothetical protein